MKTRFTQHPDRVQQSTTDDRRSNSRRAKRHVPQARPALPLISWEDVLGRR